MFPAVTARLRGTAGGTVSKGIALVWVLKALILPDESFAVIRKKYVVPFTSPVYDFEVSLIVVVESIGVVGFDDVPR